MFLSIEVAVKVEGWMARAIGKYFFAYLNERIACRKKAVKANDIAWFFSSACNLRRHWIDCVERE